VSEGFRRLVEREVYVGHTIRVSVGTFAGPDGEVFERDCIRHPGAVAVVAIDGEEAVLVRQYRPALDRELLEIPAGTRDRAGEEPDECARRELAEEIGATAEGLDHLASYWVAPGISDERMHVFLATGLTFGPRASDGPEEQHMAVERIRLADVERLIAAGTLEDAKTITGLLLARRRLGSAS